MKLVAEMVLSVFQCISGQMFMCLVKYVREVVINKKHLTLDSKVKIFLMY